MKQHRKRQNQSGFAHVAIALVVMAMVALALSAWWVWDKSSEKKILNKEGKTSQDTEEKQEQNNQDQSSKVAIPEGFIVYENKDLNFSFAYPEEIGLLAASPNNNAGVLLYVKSTDAKDAFSPHTHSPLYITGSKIEGFTTSAAKYGPVLELMSDKWIVSSKNGGDINNGGREIGSEYAAKIVKNIDSTPVYDFSYTDEGCHRTNWVFKTAQAFVSIMLPAVCADEIDAIPQERLTPYEEVAEKVLNTITF
jgi:hypothetical protein